MSVPSIHSRPSRLFPAAALGALLLTCFACSSDADAGPGWAGSLDTLANGAVVVTSPADGLWAPGEEWRLVEDVRIGRVEGEGPDLLGRVSDLAVDPAGRVWISDGQALEVKVFGSDGTWVRNVGMEGEGPGEFGEGPALRWGPAGRLWALDQRLGRFSRFDTAGTYLDAVPRHSTSTSFPWRGVVLDDGTILDVGSRFDRQSFTSVLVHKDSLGIVNDTLDLPAPAPDWIVARENGITRYIIPHGPSLVWRLDKHGGLWFGLADSLRIVRRDVLGGDTTRIVRKPVEPVPVTEADKDSVMWLVERVRSTGGDATRSDLPDTKPAFRSFEVDPEGRLWVMPQVADDSLVGRAFDVFDSEGRFLGRVTSETKLSSPFVFGDGVLWATTRDELDVPYVVRMRIEGR